MVRGKKNVYTCGKCGEKMVTVDLDDGVAPFMTDCAKCGGFMTSAFYAVDQSLLSTHEWYSPGPNERARMAKTARGLGTLRDHVNRGGLLLREIGSAGIL